jgi:proteic killer suppression protein
VIKSFKDERTRRIWEGEVVRSLPHGIQRTSRRKLRLLAAATDVLDLRQPPGNHLELLRGDRAGQHSIRINDQYRICFRWTDDGAEDVEITDYH